MSKKTSLPGIHTPSPRLLQLLRLPAPFVLTLLVACGLLAGCGSDFKYGGGKGRKGNPLAAVYDLVASYPDLDFPILARKGLRLGLEITIDPITDGHTVTGTVMVREAQVMSLPESFDPKTPIDVSGQLRGDALAILPFGPVTVGGQQFFIELIGMVSPDGRLLDGIARLANISDEGTWYGVKQRSYLIAASDFGLQGTVSVITVRFGNTRDVVFEVRRDAELISGDPVAASSGGLALIVNRLFFDNIQVLDPASSYLTAAQFTTGNGSNPHDALEAAPGKIYVTRYEPAFDDILVADPNTGAALASIPLAQLATNASGTARPDRLARAGDFVLVTMQNIGNTFQDYGPGLAAFIDPNDNSIVASLELAGQNPFGPPSVHPSTGEIYLADAGIFPGLLSRSLSGGIEVLDPVTLTSKGILVDDDDAGGNIAGVAVTGDTTGYMVVVGASGGNSLRAFDPATGAVGPTVLATPALIPEIRYDGDGYLLVAEHDTSNPGLRVIDPNSASTVVRIPLSLPPVSLAILTRDLSGSP
jgi:hypothetical protein